MACAALAGAAALLAGCGERQPGVPVGQAEAPGRIPSLRAPADTLAADSLAADSLFAADSLAAADSLGALAPPPDFAAFWDTFRAAAAAGQASALAAPAARDGLEDALAPPFRERVLALEPRDFARAGTRRTAVVRVGFDAAGRVVPEDEAARDAAVTLAFDVAEGGYRLVDAAQ